VEQISDESDDLRWWPLDALPPDSDTVATMVSAARTRTTGPQQGPVRAHYFQKKSSL
jgi:hypothetical protein